MPVRFRRTLKLGSLRLNLGKTGITGISMGKRGMSITAGKKGLRANLGIPGTGLSLFKVQSNPTQPNPELRSEPAPEPPEDAKKHYPALIEKARAKPWLTFILLVLSFCIGATILSIVSDDKTKPTPTGIYSIMDEPTLRPTRRPTLAPTRAHPIGTTGKCDDGTYTSAQHKQGACSNHGGISQWWGP